ncbi:MAG: phosphate-starvation-inducible PsiE family protein [Proteobacteria bacterium]|nr:phosphate-starvation-inducible PsiE family protein [Pseudomonadota bacterium]
MMTDPFDKIQNVRRRAFGLADRAGVALVRGFHLLALFAIGATIVWAAVFAFLEMANRGHASVEDILLLFIYLELGAMVGIYFSTNHMPVRFLIYVALTALTRLLIGMVNFEHVDLKDAINSPHMGLVVVTGGILVLSVAVLVLRYASYKYPAEHPTVRGGAAGHADDMA